jgi:hypothetical protein
MRMAGERLSNRVLKVTRQVAAARQLRSEVTDQLSDVHRLLVEALGVADQLTPSEHVEQSETELGEHTNGAEPPDAALVPEDQTRQPDQPTARFGLHPY